MLLIVFLITTAFVASGNSCANSGKVTDNEPKHYIFQGGFFYIHSLSNGESVVMYKLPNQEILPVQYTFLNPDCMYVTYRYDILENSTMINESEVSESIDDFSINGTLTFTLQGIEKIITYEINKDGFTIQTDIEEIMYFPEPDVEKIPHNKKIEEINATLSDFKFVSPFKLTYMDDGRYFHQKSFLSKDPVLNVPYVIQGIYTFKTSENMYNTMHYLIFEPFSNKEVKIGKTIEIEYYTEADQEAYYNYMSEIVEGDLVLKYFFDKNGIHVIGTEEMI